MTTFTENGFTAIVELKGAAGTNARKLSGEVLKMCKTMDDVQRCASMGDFRITRYDLARA